MSITKDIYLLCIKYNIQKVYYIIWGVLGLPKKACYMKRFTMEELFSYTTYEVLHLWWQSTLILLQYSTSRRKLFKSYLFYDDIPKFYCNFTENKKLIKSYFLVAMYPNFIALVKSYLFDEKNPILMQYITSWRKLIKYYLFGGKVPQIHCNIIAPALIWAGLEIWQKY